MADPKYSDIVQKYINPSSKPASSSAAPAPAAAAAPASAPASAPAPAPAPAAAAAPASAPASSSAAPAPATAPASATIRSDGSNGAYPSRAAPAALASFVPDPSVTPQVVKAALAKVGVTGNSITPEQLLALATSLGISEVAESTELDRIRKLSGLSEESNLNEGPRDKFASWVIDQMISSGGRKAQQSALANLDAIGPRAAEIAAAKKVAREIQARGVPGSAAVPSAPAAASAVDNAAGTVDNAATRAAGTVDNAAGAVDNAAGAVDNVVPAASQSLLYKTTYALGKLGGKFTRLVKNNKFLSLLAALAALGVAVYLLGKDDPVVDPNKPPVDPNKPPVDPDKPVLPRPVTDPQEEERKRQLAELEKLLARLNDGWPTDPETAEAIKAAVAIGAKAPAGAVASTSAVNTQPAAAASAAPRIDPRTGMDMNRFK